ncbi:hypothetical protein RJ639_003684 [Escallonia herrerae]|uniref:PCI domain-containing protein n=1 Tax=Escallonia herrerae TaxID=1293975 RepID=A0AA89B134_9ASTE|nr:hypothetical protein RJ639_003684 [Escallonia herrerae]
MAITRLPLVSQCWRCLKTSVVDINFDLDFDIGFQPKCGFGFDFVICNSLLDFDLGFGLELDLVLMGLRIWTAGLMVGQIQRHYTVDSTQAQGSSYYAPSTGSEALSWTTQRVDNSSVENGIYSNSSFPQHAEPSSRNIQHDLNVASTTSTSSSGAANIPQEYNYAAYQSTDPYGYGNTAYAGYYNGYQQQSNQSYPQPVGACQSTGAPHQPLSSFQNTGSYAGPTSYSSTYYNPGDYQTSGGYASGGYSNQTNLWPQGNYSSYTSHQYPNYTPESHGAYSSSSASATSLQYQQHYKQWADYYSQTEVSCAPGTENTAVNTPSNLGGPVPAVTSVYPASSSQPPAPFTSSWKPESSSAELPTVQPSAETSGVYDGYWKHGATGFRNHHASHPQSHFQKPIDPKPTYGSFQPQQSSEPPQVPNAQYTATHQVPQMYHTSFPTVPQSLTPLDTHRVSNMQIPANPRIASNLTLGLPKTDMDSLPSGAASKPAYISVPMPKFSDKVPSHAAADSILKPGMFPKSLRGYVERALSRCKDDTQKIACQVAMKEEKLNSFFRIILIQFTRMVALLVFLNLEYSNVKHLRPQGFTSRVELPLSGKKWDSNGEICGSIKGLLVCCDSALRCITSTTGAAPLPATFSRVSCGTEDVDDGAVELVAEAVEVAHADLAEVARMVLVEEDAVMIYVCGVDVVATVMVDGSTVIVVVWWQWWHSLGVDGGCEYWSRRGLECSTPVSLLAKNRRSPSRRYKSRWEPLPEEKTVEKHASVTPDTGKYGGWIHHNERDKQVGGDISLQEYLEGFDIPQRVERGENASEMEVSIVMLDVGLMESQFVFSDGKAETKGNNLSSVKFSLSDQRPSFKFAPMPAKRQRLGAALNRPDNDDTSSDSDKEQTLTAYYSGAIALADSPEERKRRENRSKRFEKGHGNRVAKNNFRPKNGGAGSLYTKRATALVLSKNFEDGSSRAVEDIDWDSLTVKGTCQDIEKRYLRLTSAPDPATVRPEEVLEKALLMVQTSSKNYLYKCDQLKSIRQDLTVQRIRNELTVKVYETHARLAIEVGDLSECNQCQSQLKTLYAEGINGCHMEFAAYNMLRVILHSNNNRDLLSAMSRLSVESRKDEAVKHALAVRAAVTSGNYVLFFRLYKTAPNLNTCLMDLYVEKMRYAAVTCMSRSYRPTLPVIYIAQVLGFNSSLASAEASDEKDTDGLDECVEWLKAHGAYLTADNSGELLLDGKASASSLYMPEPDDAVSHGDASLAVNDFLTRSS